MKKMAPKHVVLFAVIFFTIFFPTQIVNSIPMNSITGESITYSVPSETLTLHYSPVFGVDSMLALYLPFCEESGDLAFDCSGNGNDAVLESAMWLADGGLHFDGYDDYVEVSDDPSLRSESATWSCWFKLDDLTLSNRFLLWKNQGGHHSSDIQIKQDNDQISVIFDMGGEYSQLSAVSLTADKWYNLVVVWDKANDFFGLYINGILVDSNCYPGGTTDNMWNFKIGGNGIANQSINGIVKGVCVYANALSASEVTYLYTVESEVPRVNPSSKYIVGGWVSRNNDSIPIFQQLDVQIHLNATLATQLSSNGTYKFVFNVPEEVGNYTYELTIDNSVYDTAISVVVDRVTVSESGGDDVFTGEKGLIWFMLESDFDGQAVVDGSVTLSNGHNAIWNPALSRWEYTEMFDGEGSSSLTVMSVFWNKYCLSALNSNVEQNEAIITWKKLTWYDSLVVLVQQLVAFIFTISPLVWGIIGTLLILVVLLKFGILTLELDIQEANVLKKLYEDGCRLYFHVL